MLKEMFLQMATLERPTILIKQIDNTDTKVTYILIKEEIDFIIRGTTATLDQQFVSDVETGKSLVVEMKIKLVD